MARGDLTNTLKTIPQSVFYARGKRTPNYNLIFVHCVGTLFRGARQTAKQLLDGIAAGKAINLSSFQRAVALESARRLKAKKGRA